jgi:hypothetical protein
VVLEVKCSRKILTYLVRIDVYCIELRVLNGEVVGPERAGTRNYYKLAVRGHSVLHVVLANLSLIMGGPKNFQEDRIGVQISKVCQLIMTGK